MIFLVILLAEIGASLYYFFLMSKLLDCYFVEKDQRGFLLLSGGKSVENSINCGKKPFLNIFKCFISRIKC